METINELIQKYCPDGVQYKPMWSLTAWDKRFSEVERSHQKKIIKYYYYLAKDIVPLIVENGDVKILTTSFSNLYTTKELAGDTLAHGEVVSIPWGGNLNIQYYKGDFITSDNRIATSLDTNILDNKYLYYWMNNNKDLIESFYRGAGIKHPSMNKVLNLDVPVPPIEVQHKIVQILDNFTELEARKRQYEYYRDQLLSYKNLSAKDHADIIIKPLQEVVDIIGGKDYKNYGIGNIPVYGSGGIMTYIDTFAYDKPTVLLPRKGSISNVFYLDKPFWNVDTIFYTKIHKELIPKFFYHYICNYHIEKLNTSNAARPALTRTVLNKIPIPVPSLETQKKIISKLDYFESLVTDISEGLPAEIAARHQQYEYYRDQLLTFKRKA